MSKVEFSQRDTKIEFTPCDCEDEVEIKARLFEEGLIQLLNDFSQQKVSRKEKKGVKVHRFSILLGGALIGVLTFTVRPRIRAASIGMFIFPEYRGRWMSRQFLSKAYDIGFNVLGNDVLVAESSNPKVGKILGKENFRLGRVTQNGVLFYLYKIDCRWI